MREHPAGSEDEVGSFPYSQTPGFLIITPIYTTVYPPALKLNDTTYILPLVQTQYERTVKDNDILNQRLTKAQQDYENQLMQSDQLAGENSQKNAELKLKEEEVSALKTEIARINKLREGIQRKLRNVEEQKQEVESSRESLRQHITSLERGMQSTLYIGSR